MPPARQNQSDSQPVSKPLPAPAGREEEQPKEGAMPSSRSTHASSSSLDPSAVLMLQRTVGNQAVLGMLNHRTPSHVLSPSSRSASLISRQIEPVVQRLSFEGTKWNTVTEVTHSADGQNGGVYFADDGGGKVVIKFTNTPAKSLAATDLLRHMEVHAPATRAVPIEGEEGALITDKIRTLAAEEDRRGLARGLEANSHYLIMEFVEGESARRTAGGNKTELFQDAARVQELGRLAAADTFLEVGDRLIANQNPGNLMVDSRHGQIAAIDNDKTDNHTFRDEETLRQLKEGDGQMVVRFADMATRFGGGRYNERFVNKQAGTGMKDGYKRLRAYCLSVQDREGHPHRERARQVLRQIGNVDSESGCCFLTTACVEYKGLADDCEELTVLRAFRDGYMSKLADGPTLIQGYYALAPTIVRCIWEDEEYATVLEGMYQVVRQCMTFIQAKQPERALQEYVRQVLLLEARYLAEPALA